MSRLRVWTIGGPATASTRLRIHQYLPRLEADGVAVRVQPIPHGYVQRLILRTFLGRGDRLLVQKKLFAPREVERLRARCSRLLYDVDDAVYLGGPRDAERFRAVTASADRVLAGNAVLAGAAARPERALVLPTPVDTERIRPSGRAEPGLVTWVGTRTNLPNLELVMDAFSRARVHAPRARLVVMADRPPGRLPDGVEFARWSVEAETAILARAETGIMPLADTPFNRAKCGFKILLYQAAGLAVIASPVGLNRELVSPEKDGFLPETEAAWEDAFTRLATRPGLARGLGAAGRERVEATHSVGVLYPRFRQALLEAP